MADLELLFCRPRTPQVTEDRMDLEADAAEELGIRYHSTFLEDVVDGDLERALEELPGGSGRQLLYRGWMLTEDEYGALHEAVLDRGHALVVTPDEYAAAHYLPNYYPAIEDLTAPSRWTWSTEPRRGAGGAVRARAGRPQVPAPAPGRGERQRPDQ